MSNKLSEYITVNRQFLRSIRLDADFGRIDALQGYILQPSSQTVLDTMAKHLFNTQQRAFTWTGPYGGGKSSLALVLASLAGGNGSIRKAACATLGSGATDGVLKYFSSKKPWAVLPVVGKRASIIDEVGLAIDTHLHSPNVYSPHRDAHRNVITELVHAAETRDGIGGVLLIIDELGKFLEYAAHTGEDIGFYQDLAEAACRCKGKLVVIGVLHQAFEQYASRLGQSAQQEWKKVQGRFADIPLVAGSDEVISLLSRALHVTYDHRRTSSKIAARVAKAIQKRRPSAASNIKTLLDACWPLHPVTAAMLGPASKKRFGQNERSVFSFLASAEPLGFMEVISGLNAGPRSYFWPHQFWDYLHTNFEPAILASPDGHRWAGCVEAIERTEARFLPLHVELVKTVSLIEIFRNGSGLAAEEGLLNSCVNQKDAESITSALSELCSASILVFRKHLNAYGITAGSDFDIEMAIREAKTRLDAVDLSKLTDLIDLSPVTARRHYWDTGAMRWFSRNIVHEFQAENYVAKFESTSSQCGEFLLVIGWQHKQQDATKTRQQYTKALAKLMPGKGLLVGAPENNDRIEDLVNELAALEYVRQNSQQLDGDSIARREIAARLQAMQSMLSDELRDAFHAAIWYYGEDAKNTRQFNNTESLSHLASEIANIIYKESPCVHSELVNRNGLSSNAAKAQRELLHAMLTKANQPSLGYMSFSADAGLYHTVVRALGLHRPKKGEWYFFEPNNTERSVSMQPAWKAAKTLLFDSNRIVTLDELYCVWSRPPIGIKAGLLPIFALAFFMVHRNQLALYTEGMFTPDVKEACIDEWLQDPRRIGWRFVRIESTKKELLQLLSTALSARLGAPVAADALDSARGLVALVHKLEMWTRRTNRVSQDAQNVRRLLLNASDPHKVLFTDLPLTLNTHEPQQLAQRIADITGELSDAFEQRLRDVESQLLDALDHQGDFEHLNKRGKIVTGVGADFKLDAFAIRLSTYAGTLDDIEGLLMLATGKTSNNWTDHDIDAGEMQLLSWAIEFRRLESLAEVRDRPATRRAIGVVFGTKKTVTGTFDVSETDNQTVQMLANELLAKMKNDNLKSEIFLAAIAEVGAVIFEDMSIRQRVSHD
jgi:hypothetical protein